MENLPTLLHLLYSEKIFLAVIIYLKPPIYKMAQLSGIKT
jgi:hypothetical protein